MPKWLNIPGSSYSSYMLRDHFHAQMAQHTVHMLRNRLHAQMAHHVVHMLRNRPPCPKWLNTHAKRSPPCPNDSTHMLRDHLHAQMAQHTVQ